MKKVIITVLGAILLGSLFAFFYFKNTKEDIVDAFYIANEADAFQVGVYKNYDNAVKEASKYGSGTIIQDGEFYRVYIALSSGDVTKKLKEYYDSKSINYYLKKVVIPDNFLNDFSNYQKVLATTNDYDSINKKILKEYDESLYGV